MSKAVVYYSLSGNTKEAAVEIARKLGVKIFEIEPVKPLPQNTVRQMIVGGMQSTFGRKPQIKGVPDNIDYYDEIILGTPIWAGMPAAPVTMEKQKDLFLSCFRKSIKYIVLIQGIWLAFILPYCYGNKQAGEEFICFALADRNSEMAKDNHDKLEKFIMDIK